MGNSLGSHLFCERRRHHRRQVWRGRHAALGTRLCRTARGQSVDGGKGISVVSGQWLGRCKTRGRPVCRARRSCRCSSMPIASNGPTFRIPALLCSTRSRPPVAAVNAASACEYSSAARAGLSASRTDTRLRERTSASRTRTRCARCVRGRRRSRRSGRRSGHIRWRSHQLLHGTAS